MTKDEIKKALIKCSVDSCKDCPYDNTGLYCCGKLKRDALTLITEQENEIERLKAKVKQAQLDVLNELKKKTHNYYPSIDYYCMSQHVVLVRDIDELIREVQNDNSKSN